MFKTKHLSSHHVGRHGSLIRAREKNKTQTQLFLKKKKITILNLIIIKRRMKIVRSSGFPRDNYTLAGKLCAKLVAVGTRRYYVRVGTVVHWR